ncbi:MAG TPA: class D beta-lactamase [Phaeodactylibacter sp.]|nr:class D beta-lactamase [Phaeodactylibacter sp.]
MKSISFFMLFALLLLSCQNENTKNKKLIQKETISQKTTMVINKKFQQILNAAELNGVLLVFDPQTQTYTSNDFSRSKKGFLPASTFKIPNSIIALETGIVKDENTISKWDGKKRFLKIWEQDLTFKNAFKMSCVPCYQDIARQIGAKRMNEYLKKLDYKNMVVDDVSIDNFWLKGDSRVSAMEQIDFLFRLYYSKLPISKRTEKILKDMMLIHEKTNYKWSGKTGWAVAGKKNLGWFVGYLEQGDNVYFMATNVEPKENFEMKKFSKIRMQVMEEAMKVFNDE